MHDTGDIVAGEYHIEKRISHENGAAVYLATDSRGASLILKELRLKEVTDWGIVQTFESEASVRRRVSHPSLPAFVQYFTEEKDDDTVYYLVYEYTEGASLRQSVAKNGRLAAEDAAKVLVQIGEALDYLHTQARPIVHGHVNPNTIIRRDAGDFVLVGLGESITSGRSAELHMSSDRFIAPEQLAGDTAPESDVYGLGMSVLSALVGSVESDESRAGLLASAARLAIPRRLYRVVDLMTQEDPGNRLTSAADAVEALQSPGMEQQPGQPTPMDGTQQRRIQVRSRRGRAELYVPARDTGKPEHSVVRFLLEFWITKPWLVIILLVLMSAGPAIVPLLILYAYPPARRWVRREYSRYADVHIQAGAGGVEVPNQMPHRTHREIEGVVVNRKPTGKRLQLEVLVERVDGGEDAFYVSEVSETEADEIEAFLHDQVGS
jgi:serine/threonine protein kinase